MIALSDMLYWQGKTSKHSIVESRKRFTKESLKSQSFHFLDQIFEKYNVCKPYLHLI